MMIGPLTQQTVMQIRRMIDSGEIGLGGRLIPEREMAERFGVSRSTVRQALDELRRTGEIRTKLGRGGGAFVQPTGPRWNRYRRMSVDSGSYRIVEYEAGKPKSISEAMRQQGVSSQTTVISASKENCSTAITVNLGYSKSASLYVIARLRRAAGEPISYERAYVNPDLLPDFLERQYVPSIYDAIRKECGVHIAHIDERIEISEVKGAQARYLEVEEGQPAILVRSWARDDSNNVLEYSRDLFRADRVAFLVSHDFRAEDPY